MNDIHREDPESIWKEEVSEEITALKVRVNALMRRRGGSRISPSQWREMAVNGLEVFRDFTNEFRYPGQMYKLGLSHVNAATDISNTMAQIDETLKHIAMAQFHQAGIARVRVSDDGRVVFDENYDEPTEVRQAGTTREHKGANVWEFIPPAPYTGVVIVCAADETAPLGMRCYAEAKLPGGVRKKYPITIEEEKP